MTLTLLLLFVMVGSGLIAKGYERLPRGTVPRSLARERAQARRRRVGAWMIVGGAAMLIAVVAVRTWQ